MARPRIHKSEADRMAAFRAKNFRIDLAVPSETGETLKEIASALDVTPAVLCKSMIRFALTNRNWKVSGLLPGSK